MKSGWTTFTSTGIFCTDESEHLFVKEKDKEKSVNVKGRKRRPAA